MTGSENVPTEETTPKGMESGEERRKPTPARSLLKPVVMDDEDLAEISQELLDMYEDSFKEIQEGEII